VENPEKLVRRPAELPYHVDLVGRQRDLSSFRFPVSNKAPRSPFADDGTCAMRKRTNLCNRTKTSSVKSRIDLVE
jgi:hypothetical protein